MGYELVGIKFQGSTQNDTLRVYIDHENGIGVDDCVAISHQISAILDMEEPIQQAYDLEVSSPGINRPLFKAQDYEQYLGHSAKIKMAVPLNGRRNFRGVLQGVIDSRSVQIMVDNEGYDLPISDIAKANLVDEI